MRLATTMLVFAANGAGACSQLDGSAVRSAPPASSPATSQPSAAEPPPPVSALATRVFGADALSCDSDLTRLNQVMGWQARWPREWEAVARALPASDEDLRRWSAVPTALAEDVRAFRSRRGRPGAAPKAVVRRVLQQVDDLVAALRDEDPRYFGAGSTGDGPWRSLLRKVVRPAVEGYRDALRDDYLPRAPVDPGLSSLPGGEACFRGAVKWWTSLDLPTASIVEIGERLLEDSRRSLGASNADSAAVLVELRRPHLETEAALIARSREALVRAERTVKRAFRHVPSAPAVVKMAAHLRPSFPAGYYRPGESPAYVINPSRPSERRLMAEVIAFHEGIPGHHLWAAYPGENRRGGFNAGLLEGWAIYAEYLADELGLYTTELDRRGMVAKHLWAASRLVIEPGLHLQGWSRDRAIKFMAEVSALPRREIELEIDRYIAMPGQSLSYMLGYDAIAQARAGAESALGSRFDLAEFHHVVLTPGSRSLEAMRKDVERWVESKREGPG